MTFDMHTQADISAGLMMMYLVLALEPSISETKSTPPSIRQHTFLAAEPIRYLVHISLVMLDCDGDGAAEAAVGSGVWTNVVRVSVDGFSVATGLPAVSW